MGMAVQYQTGKLYEGIMAIATKCGKLDEDESSHYWTSKFNDHFVTDPTDSWDILY